MIVGITGVAESPDGTRITAGSGKDTAAEQLVKEHGFVAVALADPMKRFCMEMFDFTEEQLWGPSEDRNREDRRFPRDVFREDIVGVEDAMCLVALEKAANPGKTYTDQELKRMEREYRRVHLTPRHALQQLGTEWGRECYKELWVDYCLRVAKLLMTGPYIYHHTHGTLHVDQITPDIRRRFELGVGRVVACGGVVIPDLRFHNEAKKIRDAGGQIWRVKRPINTMPGLNPKHGSEVELSGMPDSAFDHVLNNCKDIHHLHMVVDAIMARETGRIVDYDHEQRDVPPCKRDK